MNNRFHLIKSFRKRQDTFRRKMLKDGIYLILFITIVIIAFTSSLLMIERKEKGENLLHKKFEELENNMFFYAEQLKTNSTMISKWGKSGVLDLDNDLKNLDSTIIPIVEEYPFLTSFNIAGSDTTFYMLRREESSWTSFISRVDSLKNREIVLSDSTKLPDTDYLEMINSGILFNVLKENQDNNQRYFNLETPGHMQNKETSSTLSYVYNNVEYLVSFNMDRSFIEDDVQNKEISAHSQIFIFSDEDVNRELMRNDTIDNTAVSIQNVVSERDEIYHLALQNWKNYQEEESFDLRYHSELWWGMAKKGGMGNRWIMIVLPEKELFTQVIRQRNNVFYIAAFGLFISIILVSFLMRLYNRSEPLEFTSQKEKYVAKVRQLISAGEGARVEFKSTLRWHLKADKPAKEIELAILKTIVAYLNSEGGNLLIGVQDDGTICGLDNDHFVNDDKFMLHFNNMVKQHIGLEFSKYINYRIIPVNDENKVMLVECETSQDPAFLKYIEDEDFYIRVGPASRKLSTRKTLKYLANKES